VRKIKVFYTASAVLFALIVTGCSTARFSCPAPESGIKCKSVTDIYRQVTDGETGLKRTKDAKDEKDAGSGTDSPAASITKKLEQDKQIPLRIPPKIVRIWIAPWEDDEGDLNQGGYVFSEISDPRNRWIIGEKSPANKQMMKFFSGQVPSKTLGASPVKEEVSTQGNMQSATIKDKKNKIVQKKTATGKQPPFIVRPPAVEQSSADRQSVVESDREDTAVEAEKISPEPAVDTAVEAEKTLPETPGCGSGDCKIQKEVILE
jgi:conjugal transfer pilus assembly protein TraV